MYRVKATLKNGDVVVRRPVLGRCAALRDVYAAQINMKRLERIEIHKLGWRGWACCEVRFG